MILKNKTTLLCIVILMLSFTNLNAAKKRGAYATKNIIGQSFYLKACSSCHGEGSRGGNMASIREWKELFAKNAFELKDLHTDDEETLFVIEYFNSDEFQIQKVDLLDFLQEFAYDSENIPTCN
ncbi:c-type cytochrome [Poseidonibacter lekithochrous]|uniref:c-type cytochrome n=1 Tax=Poseidonibacter lekithochrous TaxID=1904463 RepID=UPI000D3CB9AE|nr:cytochrome c [Poseidonibacter lekithochrous]